MASLTQGTDRLSSRCKYSRVCVGFTAFWRKEKQNTFWMSAWTQVYVTGLPRSVLPSDEDVEADLELRYGLSSSSDGYSSRWAGRGTTIIKRDENDGRCRGFAFLSFHSREAAIVAIERINNFDDGDGDGDDDHDEDGGTPRRSRLRAEMSTAPSRERRKKRDDDEQRALLPDLRLRRQRKKPVRKHPVIVSSDGRRTNLGNKTK